ncbi:MAG TPA: endonuclease/exonuclease/phosphatase family protein, partial [Micromonosporaceae bacterium]
MTQFRRLLPVVYWMAVGLFAAFAVVRVFGWEHTWMLRVVMSFTPYITIASAIPLLVVVLARRWRAAVVAMLTTLSLVTVFVPRAVGEPDPGTGPHLRVMSSNMKLGGADPAEIVRLVRTHHIDLLAVEEYTPDAEDRLYAAGLTALLPFSATNPVPGA